MISREQFDTDFAAYVGAVGNYTAAVDAYVAAQAAGGDFSTEEANLVAAKAALDAEAAKLPGAQSKPAGS